MHNSEILEVPFSPEPDGILSQTGIPDDNNYSASLKDLIGLCVNTARPRAFYMVADIEHINESVCVIKGHELRGKIFGKELKDVYRVFPHLVTCGTELEAGEFKRDDPLEQYCVDHVRKMALNCAAKFLYQHIKAKFALKNLSCVTPGGGPADLWPIEEQKILFSILGDMEVAIGVKLTDSCLMLPVKSRSGLFFSTEKTFQMCAICPRGNCPDRRAPFKDVTVSTK